MGSLGMADSLILMVLALVVFGPRRLPQIGRQIGKLMYEFRKASNDFKFQMEEELRAAEDADRRKKEEEAQRQRALTTPTQESVSADPQIVNAVEVPEYARPVAEAEASAEPVAAAESATAGEAETVAEISSSGEAESTATSEPKTSGLQVAPPSTGETVANTPPWKRKQPADTATEASTEAAATEVANEATTEAVNAAESASPASAATTEAVTHNG